MNYQVLKLRVVGVYNNELSGTEEWSVYIIMNYPVLTLRVVGVCNNELSGTEIKSGRCI